MKETTKGQVPVQRRLRKLDINAAQCQHFHFSDNGHSLPVLTLYDYSLVALMTADLRIRNADPSASKLFPAVDKVWNDVVKRYGKAIGDTGIDNLVPECLFVPSTYNPKHVAKHGHSSVFVFSIKSMKNPNSILMARTPSVFHRLSRAVNGEYLLFCKIHDNVIEQVVNVIEASDHADEFYYQKIIDLAGMRDMAAGLMLGSTARTVQSYSRMDKVARSMEKKWKALHKLRKEGSKKASRTLQKGVDRVRRWSRRKKKPEDRAASSKKKERSTGERRLSLGGRRRSAAPPTPS